MSTFLKEPRDEIYEKYSERGKCHQTEWNMKKTLKKKGINNTAITKEGTDRQTLRRLKRIAIAVFQNLLA